MRSVNSGHSRYRGRVCLILLKNIERKRMQRVSEIIARRIGKREREKHLLHSSIFLSKAYTSATRKKGRSGREWANLRGVRGTC